MKKIIALTILINYDYKFVIMSKKDLPQNSANKGTEKEKKRESNQSSN